jgi:hypothetical protein
MSYDLVQWARMPDPNTTPAGPGFISLAVVPVDPGMIHPLNSGSTVSVRYPGGSYWSIEIAFPELDIAEARSIQPFLYSLQGAFTNFYISLPTYTDPFTGAWDISTPTRQAYQKLRTNSESNSFDIIDWASVSSTGNYITAGDVLKIDNSHKIYYVTSVYLESDVLTVMLNCDVINPINLASSKLQMNDILFKVRSTGAIPALKLGNNGLYAPFSLSLRENIL